jgi:hypothetical protein
MWSEGVDDGIHTWYFHGGAEHGMPRGDDMRERCLGPKPLAPRPLVSTHPYGEASSDPGNNNNNNNNNKDFIKERKKKHTRQSIKKIQYKNLDKQNTKMRRSLATAILLNLKEKKKKKQLKTKVKGE